MKYLEEKYNSSVSQKQGVSFPHQSLILLYITFLNMAAASLYKEYQTLSSNVFLLPFLPFPSFFETIEQMYAIYLLLQDSLVSTIYICKHISCNFECFKEFKTYVSLFYYLRIYANTKIIYINFTVLCFKGVYARNKK